MQAERRRSLYDISDVARMLAADILTLCRQLLPGGKRVGHEWQCGGLAGHPGTQMAVHLSGPKAGVWANFAGTERGDALDLVATCLFAGDKKAALQWSRQFLGIDQHGPVPTVSRPPPPDPVQVEREAEQEAQTVRASAMRLWLAASADLPGTPVDRYLAGRAIRLADLPRQPRAIRFHPGLWNGESKRSWPAMVAAISGPAGFLGIHRTWLEASGSTVRKAPLENSKMTLGPFRGGHIALWRGASRKPLAEAPAGEVINISEGIEDALSVAVTFPESRSLAAISVSNLAAMALPTAIKTVRIWRQNDTKAPAIAAFQRAVDAHLAAGRDVLLPAIGEEFKDVNDLLRGMRQ